MGGCAKGNVPFCRVKTAKSTKLSGREGAGSRGSFPATSPGWYSPPAEKSLYGQGQEVLPTSHCKDPPPTPQGRRAGFLSALPPRGWLPHVGAGPSILRAAPGPRRRRPRASPGPHPAPARGQGPRWDRPPGWGCGGRRPRGRARRGRRDSRAKARPRGRVRPHHVAAAAAADGSEASWRSTIKRGFSGGREGEESEGGGERKGGSPPPAPSRPQRPRLAAPFAAAAPPGPGPRAHKKKKGRRGARRPVRPAGAPPPPAPQDSRSLTDSETLHQGEGRRGETGRGWPTVWPTTLHW